LGEYLNNDFGITSIALDLPGFGSSEYIFVDSASKNGGFVAGSLDYARKVLKVVDSDFGDLVILGHSFGGRVAIKLASISENKVKGLVLTGVPIVADPTKPIVRPNRVLTISKKLNRFKLVPDSKVEQLKMKYGSSDYRNATGPLRDTLVKVIAETNSGIYLDDLRQLSCIIRLIWGKDDHEINLSILTRVKDELPNIDIEMLTLNGADHMAPVQQPEVFAKIISDIVSKVL
jgi:pimeloyl-ACP methyl ester carboxylesterase